MKVFIAIDFLSLSNQLPHKLCFMLLNSGKQCSLAGPFWKTTFYLMLKGCIKKSIYTYDHIKVDVLGI